MAALPRWWEASRTAARASLTMPRRSSSTAALSSTAGMALPATAVRRGGRRPAARSSSRSSCSSASRCARSSLNHSMGGGCGKPRACPGSAGSYCSRVSTSGRGLQQQGHRLSRRNRSSRKPAKLCTTYLKPCPKLIPSPFPLITLSSPPPTSHGRRSADQRQGRAEKLSSPDSLSNPGRAQDRDGRASAGLKGFRAAREAGQESRLPRIASSTTQAGRGPRPLPSPKVAAGSGRRTSRDFSRYVVTAYPLVHQMEGCFAGPLYCRISPTGLDKR